MANKPAPALPLRVGDQAILEKVLRTSKTRRFVDVKTVNSAIRTRMHAGEEVAKTVHCWIFERPGHAAGRAPFSHH